MTIPELIRQLQTSEATQQSTKPFAQQDLAQVA